MTNTDKILNELEDRFKVDPLSIYSRAADAIALQQEICDKLFRSLIKMLPLAEPLLTPSEQMIIQESLTSYQMLTTFFGDNND